MVLKRLFGLKIEPEERHWRAPAGRRLYAIGDVHGRLDLLNELLEQIDADDARRGDAKTDLIFLGDLIDRGPDSRGVVEKVMSLCAASAHVRCLGGNHEDLLLRCHEGDKEAASVFNRAGGRATMLSYGVSEDEYDSADAEEAVAIVARVVPDTHVRFLSSLEDFVQAGDYLFVHAGIRPGRAIDQQSREDMRWIRHEFTRNRDDHGVMVIHGHTITEDVDAQINRVGIDTGAFHTGKLTAIGMEGRERWFLQTGA
jgi:serine/threonine protein phosphatase 1